MSQLRQKNVRQKTMTLAILNVSTEPPFDPQNYINIFDFLFENKSKYHGIFGNERLTLASMKQNQDKIEGIFKRFTRIDPHAPWFDNQTGETLIDSDGNPIPQIRDNIYPNSKDIYFSFYIESHKLIFDTKNITIPQFFLAFSSLVSHFDIVTKFGAINTHILPNIDAIDLVLGIYHKESIFYTLTIPNPESTSLLESQITARMKNMNISGSKNKITAQSGRSLEPDDELQATLSLSAKNGYVEVSGKTENGTKEKRSTKEYPRKEKFMYSGNMSTKEAFSSNSDSLSKYL